MTSYGELRVTMGDLMSAGHCVRGIRRWFAERNMDWRPLLGDGVLADDLAATGDPMVVAAIELKIRKLADG